MKIALLGYGRMGKEIEKHAKKRNHKISFILDKQFQEGEINDSDVAINFSIPEAAVSNIKLALEKNIPVVSGTTGWLDDFDSIISFCQKKKGAFLYASNFSIGVNLFFKINQHLAKLMKPYETEYNTYLKEIHHTNKIDAPSGTAITLAEEILKYYDYKEWSLQKKDDNILHISSVRKDKIPGTHKVSYFSNVDEISIKHKAFNRDGFAFGAVIAAEWILNKKGVFSMKDVLNIT